VRVPRIEAPPGKRATVTFTPWRWRTEPSGSRSWTTGAELRSTPRTAVAGGCDARVSPGGVPGLAVAVKLTVPTPEMTAVALFPPGAAPSVHWVEARPSASVMLVSGASVPPPCPGIQATASPGTGLSEASRARTTSGAGSAVPTTPDCPSPEISSSTVAAPATAVCVKSTGDPARPGAVASVC
jgi:hypothetical protein